LKYGKELASQSGRFFNFCTVKFFNGCLSKRVGSFLLLQEKGIGNLPEQPVKQLINIDPVPGPPASLFIGESEQFCGKYGKIGFSDGKIDHLFLIHNWPGAYRHIERFIGFTHIALHRPAHNRMIGFRPYVEQIDHGDLKRLAVKMIFSVGPGQFTPDKIFQLFFDLGQVKCVCQNMGRSK
jgi:hypothetical protein